MTPSPTGAAGPPSPGPDRTVLGVLALLAGAVVVFGVVLARVAPPTPPDLGDEVTVFPVPQPLPEFSLTDHRATRFDRTRVEGRWSLLFFGYTYCPDVCPFTLQNLAHVQRLLSARADPSPAAPQVVFVSVDPERDTTERLREYVGFFDPAFVGVTGEAEEIDRLTRGVGAFFEKEEAEANAGYLVNHSALLFLLDPQARLRAVLDDPHDPEEFVRLLAAVQSLGVDS
ncbi:MAG: SCO family protein [Proteobacteria bacterium]|nr:SCO family protein [Pseudomonadota bacterium]